MRGLLPCALAAAAMLVSPARADPASDANDLFARGRQLFLAERYREALTALEQSNRLDASPNTTLLAARCLEKLDRREEAVRAFDETASAARALVTAGEQRYRPTVDAAVADRERLKAEMGTLLVQTVPPRPGAEVHTPRVDATTDARGEAEITHRPGRFTIEIRGGGGPSETREVTIEAGRRSTLRLAEGADTRPTVPDAATPDTGATWLLPAGIVGASVGAVAMGAGIVFWTQAQRKWDALDAECPSGCGPGTKDQRARASDGDTFELAGNIVFVSGAVVGLTGAGFLVARAAGVGSDRVALGVAPTVGGLQATLTFRPPVE